MCKSSPKLIALDKNRLPKTRLQNVQVLADKGVDLDFSVAHVEFLLNYLPENEFPIDLNDTIFADYGVDREDFGNFLEFMLKIKRFQSPPTKNKTCFLGIKQAFTVFSTLHFLEWCAQIANLKTINSSKNR